MSQRSGVCYQFGPFQLDPQEQRLTRNGRPVPLTPKAFEVLLVLLQNDNRLVSKEDLMREIWPDSFVEENNLTKNISRIRTALDEGSSTQGFIETVSKRGYRFRGSVTEIQVSDPGTRPMLLAVVASRLNQGEAEAGHGSFIKWETVLSGSAERYGCISLEIRDDNQVCFFQVPEAAVRFGLTLLEQWRQEFDHFPDQQLLVGIHMGECREVEPGRWSGQSVKVAKALLGAAGGGSVVATESVLDQIDRSLYCFHEAGPCTLQDDWLPRRLLYRIVALNSTQLEDRIPSQLSATDWFLRAASFQGSDEENGQEEMRCYQEALRLDPDYPQAHNNLGVLFARTGNLSAAAEHYREAIRCHENYPEAHYNYAILLETQRRSLGASLHYREALRLRPEYLEAHLRYANLMMSKGNLQEAASHFKKAVQLYPDVAELHNNYAIALEDLQDNECAERHYREALRLKPDYPEAHYNYALFLEKQKDLANAELHYNHALQFFPDYAEAHNNLAVLLHNRGELLAAREHYREGLRLRPNDPEAHYNYALLLKRTGQLEGAEKHLKQAFELAPEMVDFRSTIEMPD